MARLVAALAVLAGALVAMPSRADGLGRLMVDWSRFEDVLRLGTASVGHGGGFRLGEEERPTPRAAEEIPWIGSSPHLALIARDWGGSQRLVGRLALTDRLRPIRSSRMLVSRLRISDGRVMPFLQVGLGQWRIDTDLLPTLPHDVELAAQLGGGVEIALSPRATLALESDITVLYREQHEAQMVCEPHIWNSMLAARFEF